MVDITLALTSLYPGKRWSLTNNNYSTLVWDEPDIPVPTEQDLVNEANRLTPIVVAQNKRFSEYPSVEDQLDMLYHLGYDGWKAKIKEIKDSIPIPK